MVKQGHYAQVSRQKKLRQLKQRHQAHADRTIDYATVAEFLLVRYHLTQAKHQRPAMRKTMQQFMTQWLAIATADESVTWSVTTITKQTLQQFNRQLPWQGYALIQQALPAWQAFMVKEVPAVPLNTRLQVTDLLTATTIPTVISEQLAVNTLLGMFSDNREKLAQVTADQVQQLQAGFMTAGALDWTKVASLVAPVTLSILDQNAKNQTWLEQLAKLTPADFNSN